jgi:hypothetical protein
MIEIKPISLSKQEVTESIECYLKFNDTYLEYRMNFWAKDKGPDIITGADDEPYAIDCTRIIKREAVTEIMMEYIPSEDVWSIIIEATGTTFVRMYLKTERETKHVYKTALAWVSEIWKIKTLA